MPSSLVVQDGERFDEIYCSTAVRAKQTCSLALQTFRKLQHPNRSDLASVQPVFVLSGFPGASSETLASPSGASDPLNVSSGSP